MGGKWDYGLQLHGVHHTQELLAQLEFCDTVTTGPRRCGEYAQKYFFRPPLATLTMKVSQNFTCRLRRNQKPDVLGARCPVSRLSTIAGDSSVRLLPHGCWARQGRG